MSAREELSNVMDIEYAYKSLLRTIFENRRLRDESEQRIRPVRSCLIHLRLNAGAPAVSTSCPRSAKTGFKRRDRFSSSLIFHMDTAVFTSSGRHVVRNRGGRSDDNERYRVQVTTTA